jgi:hypothetical protein
VGLPERLEQGLFLGGEPGRLGLNKVWVFCWRQQVEQFDQAPTEWDLVAGWWAMRLGA